MRPPVCAICDRDLEGAGGSVRFVSRPSDLDWRDRAAEPGFVGHPPDTDWFCAEHVEAARALAGSTTIDVALGCLRRGEKTDSAETVTESEAGPEIGAVERYLRDHFAGVATALGLAAAEVVTTDDRQWMPMDGSQPPDCPFVLTSRRRAESDAQLLELVFDRSHWSDESIAQASITLAARGAIEFTVAASIPADGSSLAITGVTATGRDVGRVTQLVDGISALSSPRR